MQDTNINKINRYITMSYPAMRVVNTLIKFAIEDNEPMTQIKILKLIYFANGVQLVLKKEKLITEDFTAWTYGPVIESVYNKTKIYGAKPIESMFNHYEPILEQEDTDAFKSIYNTYMQLKHYEPFQLVNLTHKIGGAWDKAYDKCKYSVINAQDIIEEFKNYVKIKE
jgi:uncharacterized phage-associated protein